MPAALGSGMARTVRRVSTGGVFGSMLLNIPAGRAHAPTRLAKPPSKLKFLLMIHKKIINN